LQRRKGFEDSGFESGDYLIRECDYISRKGAKDLKIRGLIEVFKMTIILICNSKKTSKISRKGAKDMGSFLKII